VVGRKRPEYSDFKNYYLPPIYRRGFGSDSLYSYFLFRVGYIHRKISISVSIVSNVQKNLQGELIPLKEGYIYDYATGKPVDIRKPEEPVRQDYEKILVEDYGYDKEQMDIEVFIQRGSKTKPKNYPDRADIVVYKTSEKNKRDQNNDILGIVETKRPNRDEGIRQLQSYVSASSAQWGVWTNGKDIEYVYHNFRTGDVKTHFIYQIPNKGENFSDIGNISKKNLKPTKNLTIIFRRMLNSLSANTESLTRRERLGSEMIKLIFCKIWDERYYPNRPPKFRMGFEDKPSDVKNNIVTLFKSVTSELKEDKIFEGDGDEKISLDDESVAYVVGELQQYSLRETARLYRDVIGDAFEVFAESHLVGQSGEFFTPRPIVKTLIEIVKPLPNQKILDPACGSGGFLTYAMENVWAIMDIDKKYKDSPDIESLKSEMARKFFFGIDKEPDLVKIAKAYMAIIGDGRGGIVQQNSLYAPNKWNPKAKELFVNESGTAFKKFDVVLTNPPFGSKTKVHKNDSGIYHLGHKWKFDKSKNSWVETQTARATEPQLLFIERCLELLDDGGVLGIILPETYFHAPSVRYVLQFIRNGNNIQAIIDLSQNSFRPYNNAKTILLVLQKGKPQQNEIIMAVAEEIGHDHTGRDLYRFDPETEKFTDKIWDDTEIIREELKNPADKDNRYTFVLNVKDIKSEVFVPRYYWEKRIKEIQKSGKSEKVGFVSVKELIDKGIVKHYSGHGSPESGFKGKGDIPYVRVADIVNWEVYKNPTSMLPEYIYLQKKGKKGIDLKEEDILFVRRGSYRIGTVAMVSKFDTKVLLTKEISVFRVIKKENEYGINPYYLLFLFSHRLTQQQLYNKVFVDTTLPNIGDRWKELLLPISEDKERVEEITKTIKNVLENKWKAQEKVLKVSHDFGGLTT
jgi:type I restriction enzyme M protein